MDIEQAQQTAISEHSQKLGALAVQLGYEGNLTVGALEDEIRFYQRRSVEDVLELGKRLLLLKEMTPHGQFGSRIQLLGLSTRLAQKFMQAARKFCKSEKNSHLKNLSSLDQGRFLELVVLDDDDIQELADGGSVLDITLDDIYCMTASELKKALREAKNDSEAKDSIIKTKDEKLNNLDTELTKLKSPAQIKKREQSEAQQKQQQAIQLMQQAVLAFLDAASTFNATMNAALESSDDAYVTDQYQANIRMTYQSMAARCIDAGLPIDFAQMVTPDWLSDAMQCDQIEQPEVIYEHQGSEG